ncbi:MAG: hypothetical protein ACJ0BI_01425 [Paracoccaceae bacterium]
MTLNLNNIPPMGDLETLMRDFVTTINDLEYYEIKRLKELGAAYISESNGSPLPIGSDFIFINTTEREYWFGPIPIDLEAETKKIFIQTDYPEVLTGLFAILAEVLVDSYTPLPEELTSQYLREMISSLVDFIHTLEKKSTNFEREIREKFFEHLLDVADVLNKKTMKLH